MAKIFYGDDEEFGEERSRGHRQRHRQNRKSSWDDAPAPSWTIPSAVSVPAPQPVQPPDNAESGTVRKFDATKGFGFVEPDRTGPDLFVHITVARRSGFETLTVGQRVTFERGPGRQPGKDAVQRIYP